MKKNLINHDHLKILRLVKKKTNSSPRVLTRKLSFSIEKIKNFKENSDILSYFYVRAPRNVAIKIALNN
jgi:hypothetical protein